MSERRSFYRKVAYCVAIAVLWFPLSYMSSPATVDSPGGTLAQLRTKHRLSQADLGEIDPASETIKLATLGLRGLAVNLLWNKATHYKKVEDWTNLAATLEQLSKLQPNFVTFWKFQSWNLSYNVSVEFDDYHDRYYWVRRGIQFLQQGARYNRDNPVLLKELGWVNGQKIGRSDEKKQYRRLYKADEVFHPEDRAPRDRDNWVVSKEYYLDSIAAIDEKGRDLGKMSPSLFYSSAPKSQMSYAEAIENDGLFDQAVGEWREGEEEWIAYGDIPIEHSTGPILRFNDEEELAEEAERLNEQLVGMSEGVEDRLLEKSRAELSAEQLAAYDTPESERTEEEWGLASRAEVLLRLTPMKIAQQIAEEDPDKRRDALELASTLVDVERRKRFTENYKETVNFDYWLLRCQFEQSDEAVAARELVYRAHRAFDEEADPFTAKGLYEEAFHKWAAVFEKFPELKNPGGTTGDDVAFIIYDYKKVIDQLDENFPDDFPLWEIVENFDSERKLVGELQAWKIATGAAEPEAAQE